MTPRIHIDPLVVPDPQLLQVTAFVPGGDTQISSRSVVVVHRRDRVYSVLDAVLRQRFPDMLHVGFEILTAHPSSKWLDPAYCPQKEKVVIVYTDEFLRREGAVYLQRRLRLRALVKQLGRSLLCGQDGENCFCFVNGVELTNERDAAVEDAAFIRCMLPLATNEAVDLVSIQDSASGRSIEFLAHDQGAGDIVACPPNGDGSSTAVA